MSFPVPKFRMVIPPGSSENGKPILAHWIVSQNGRIVPGQTIVVIGGFKFIGDPLWYQWFPYENHHTEAYSGDPTDPDGVGWPMGVSPMQLDLSSGYLKVYVKGAGSQGVVNGLLQPVSVENHEFPVDPAKRVKIQQGVEYRTISRTTHHWDPKIGHVEVWVGIKGQPMVKYVDERVPTMYTNEQLMSMYAGAYSSVAPGSGNESKTLDFEYILARMAGDFDTARKLVPTVQAEWGALSVDKTTGLVNGHLPPSGTVDSEDWVWPAELTGAPAPVPVPVPDTPYVVSQSFVDGAVLAGTTRWIAVTSNDTYTDKVEFFDGDNLLHTEHTPPYGNGTPPADSDSGAFDTKTLKDGLHTLSVKATTKDGRVAIAFNRVTVANAAPVPTPVPTPAPTPTPVADVPGALKDLHSAIVKLGG